VNTNIPGLKASHSIITPACRENRGAGGAFEEAMNRAADQYVSIVSGRDDEYNIHVVMTVETIEKK